MTDALAAARSRLALALDVPDLAGARDWIARLGGEVGVFKVGLELFSAAGPEAVRAVTEAGADAFVDLKVHDIPATVGRAVTTVSRLGARYVTVHAASGPEGLRAAAEAAAGTGTRVLAVTVLTSMDEAELEAIGMRGPVEDAVLRLARLARDAGIDGLVASPHECATLRRELGPGAVIAVPGVRPAEGARDDQRRTATPEAAIRAGASLLVVGRPIRNADDPVASASDIVRRIAEAGAAPS